LGDGQILVRLIEKTKDLAPGAFRPRGGALRVSVDLSRIDTLMFFGDIERVTVRAPWGPTPVVPARAKTTVITVQATLARACIGDQERPEIVCFGRDASRTVVRWTSEAAPVTEQEVATWRDTILAQYTQKISEELALAVLAQVNVPTVGPHYSRLVLDRVGNLWAERGGANRPAAESVEYLVFEPSGAQLGVVALPAINVLEIGDDYVVGVYRDEFEIEYLQLHEIMKQQNASKPLPEIH
jgi:hypothetical protein